MSTPLYASKLVDLTPRALHLVLPESPRQCAHCGASKFQMRWFYTENEQTWLNVLTSTQPILHSQDDEYIVAPCTDPAFRTVT